MATYGLTRASTKKQEASPAVQADSIRKHCDLLELPDVKILDEPLGTSGKKTSFATRPCGKWIMENLQKGDSLVVTKLDRLGRNTRDVLKTIETLNSRGVRIYIINFLGGQSLDISTAFGKMILTFFAGIAQFEADSCSERTRESLQWRRKNGYATHHPPFGFKIVSVKKVPGSDFNKPLKVFVPIDPAMIQYIVDRIDAGDKPYTVASDLHRKQARCRGRLWAPERRDYHVDPRHVTKAYKFWKQYFCNGSPGAEAEAEAEATLPLRR